MQGAEVSTDVERQLRLAAFTRPFSQIIRVYIRQPLCLRLK